MSYTPPPVPAPIIHVRNHLGELLETFVPHFGHFATIGELRLAVQHQFHYPPSVEIAYNGQILPHELYVARFPERSLHVVESSSCFTPGFPVAPVYPPAFPSDGYRPITPTPSTHGTLSTTASSISPSTVPGEPNPKWRIYLHPGQDIRVDTQSGAFPVPQPIIRPLWSDVDPHRVKTVNLAVQDPYRTFHEGVGFGLPPTVQALAPLAPPTVEVRAGPSSGPVWGNSSAVHEIPQPPSAPFSHVNPSQSAMLPPGPVTVPPSWAASQSMILHAVIPTINRQLNLAVTEEHTIGDVVNRRQHRAKGAHAGVSAR